MKKTGERINFLILGMLVISVMAISCKKDKDEPESAPQPENPKNYSGITDQDNPAKFGTAEIGGVLFLMSYEIKLVYYDTVHQQSYHEELSASISSGIVQFNGDTFTYSDNKLDLKGTLNNGDVNLSGNYSWKYDGNNTYDGSFNTVKQ